MTLTREVLLKGKAQYRITLLPLISLDQLIFKAKMLFTFFYKTSYLNEEVNCTEPFPLVGVSCTDRRIVHIKTIKILLEIDEVKLANYGGIFSNFHDKNYARLF